MDAKDLILILRGKLREAQVSARKSMFTTDRSDDHSKRDYHFGVSEGMKKVEKWLDDLE